MSEGENFLHTYIAFRLFLGSWCLKANPCYFDKALLSKRDSVTCTEQVLLETLIVAQLIDKFLAFVKRLGLLP
jgi:hypothetical protein